MCLHFGLEAIFAFDRKRRRTADLSTWTDEMLLAVIEGLQPEVAKLQVRTRPTSHEPQS
jgi:hypothetical protein